MCLCCCVVQSSSVLSDASSIRDTLSQLQQAHRMVTAEVGELKKSNHSLQQTIDTLNGQVQQEQQKNKQQCQLVTDTAAHHAELVARLKSSLSTLSQSQTSYSSLFTSHQQLLHAHSQCAAQQLLVEKQLQRQHESHLAASVQLREDVIASDRTIGVMQQRIVELEAQCTHSEQAYQQLLGKHTDNTDLAARAQLEAKQQLTSLTTLLQQAKQQLNTQQDTHQTEQQQWKQHQALLQKQVEEREQRIEQLETHLTDERYDRDGGHCSMWT